MWEDMQLMGANGWLEAMICANTLVAVTDGSYMQALYPNMNSCAFILECLQGRGRLTGAFSEQTMVPCSYQGEPLGLMAIHLILLSINKITPDLMGLAHIFSDCLGTLDKIRNLPPHHIPSKCRHSVVLKNVMLHCSLLSFVQLFSQVSVHQDNQTKFKNLPRKAQLNCAVVFGAKRALLSLDTNDLPQKQKVPLEAFVYGWVGRRLCWIRDITSDIMHIII
jgi:hypothetical protein